MTYDEKLQVLVEYLYRHSVTYLDGFMTPACYKAHTLRVLEKCIKEDIPLSEFVQKSIVYKPAHDST